MTVEELKAAGLTEKQSKALYLWFVEQDRVHPLDKDKLLSMLVLTSSDPEAYMAFAMNKIVTLERAIERRWIQIREAHARDSEHDPAFLEGLIADFQREISALNERLELASLKKVC